MCDRKRREKRNVYVCLYMQKISLEEYIRSSYWVTSMWLGRNLHGVTFYLWNSVPRLLEKEVTVVSGYFGSAVIPPAPFLLPPRVLFPHTHKESLDVSDPWTIPPGFSISLDAQAITSRLSGMTKTGI